MRKYRRVGLPDARSQEYRRKMVRGRKSEDAPESSTPNPALDFNGSIVVLISIIANRITSTGTAIFRERHGLGSTEWRVLAAIAAEPSLTGVRIAQLVGLDQGVVSRTVKKLASNGLVAVAPDERQSNYMNLELTAKGAAVHAEAIKTAFEREEMLLSAIPAERQEDFIETLHRVLAKTDELSLRAKA